MGMTGFSGRGQDVQTTAVAARTIYFHVCRVREAANQHMSTRTEVFIWRNKMSTDNELYVDSDKYKITAARTESTVPAKYRLVIKNNQLALQGYYTWMEGYNSGGEWRYIPIINLDNVKEVPDGK